MKILKKGNYFVAYRDKHDVNTPDGVGMNDQIKIGDSLGKINIDTEKFVGNTFAMLPLIEHLKNNPPTPKRKRVWNVTFVDKDGEVIDETQIDEKRASLAWSLFKEFGHTKEKGMKLEWEADWEEVDD